MAAAAFVQTGRMGNTLIRARRQRSRGEPQTAFSCAAISMRAVRAVKGSLAASN